MTLLALNLSDYVNGVMNGMRKCRAGCSGFQVRAVTVAFTRSPGPAPALPGVDRYVPGWAYERVAHPRRRDSGEELFGRSGGE
jgi:hypothetical protein